MNDSAMDSCSPSSPAPVPTPVPRAAVEKTKSHHAFHNSLVFPAAAAVASTKPRKPSASALKPSGRLHPTTSRISAPPRIEKKTDSEPGTHAVIQQGLPSPKSGEKSAPANEAPREEMAMFKDEASKNEKGLDAHEDPQAAIDDGALKKMKLVAENESVGIEKDQALGEEMTLFMNETVRKTGIQNDALPLQEIKWNDIAEKEHIKGHDCTENRDALAEEEKEGDRVETSVTEYSNKILVATDIQEGGVPFDHTLKKAVSSTLEKDGTDTQNALKNFLKVPTHEVWSSPVADTKTVVHSEQISKFSACTGQPVPGSLKTQGELDVKQSGCGLICTEILDSEQEGFYFPKGESIFKESVQSSEALPTMECSTAKKVKEQDVSSFSQFEITVIAASDLKSTPSATVLDVACNGISSKPSLKDMGFIEAAMYALTKDVPAKCPALENMHRMAGRSALSCPWKLSRRAFVIPSLVVPVLLCLLCFASGVIQDERMFLHPT